MVVQIDDFLRNFNSFNQYARRAEYTGVVNPEDGIMYPDISEDIPEQVKVEVKQNLEAAMGWPVQMNTIFMRNTSSNTATAPNQAHTDTIMGTHIFLLYMQDGPEGAGTSLVRHKELGFDKDPITEAEVLAWQSDKNTPDAWEITSLIEMKANRAVCGIWSGLMHRAEPIQGFGDSIADGRLAMILFYERAS